ncbi:class I SAM-dependent DNA methyltransferase [Secundilactobacillus malefermentans]|uniref:Methyltransferase domain-containing protein n=1 Tax=Secundilactobacillus malefermentans TaxID=176292 RepID=A0A4R5NP69_9LACO|nr:class I SAM-dependent methyltransferase [Secundilactobacillus malefermentans]KRM57397.1 methyltransferase [Secundilactobacillus malefermentans DSM 5705 = KCTC 3548]QEA30720.1 class I SAM-dependent methyltransferase [Secundilactobacillus malefermentans]TDG78430.1 hypothetical protein C5L31_000373 [Secundilactobacillus malefermentans]
MIYSTFAKLYDELFDPAMYDEWLDFVNQNIERRDGQLLDLACGTGRLAVKLLEAGYLVSGFDLSDEMLSLARVHAEEIGKSLPLMQGNMLDLSDLESYQNITCFADSFCYLTDEDELEQAFGQVEKHLKEGGQFLFDVISPYQTDIVYPGYMYNYQDEEQAFIWSSYGTDIPHSVEHDLTFFTLDEDKQSYARVSELHEERTYPLETYKSLLKKVGFRNIEVKANFGKDELNDKTTRWFFSCSR